MASSPQTRLRPLLVACLTVFLAVQTCFADTPREAASAIDRLVAASLEREGVEPAPFAADETFLRRLSLDLTGQYPTSEQIALFGLDGSDDRVARQADELLSSASYGQKWARYWEATIFSRKTNTRRTATIQENLKEWLADEINAGASWDAIVSDLLTATGNSETEPRVAFLLAHAGEPEEIAGEASRVFMGVQVSCAQCHDHPFDRWKRDEFHEFAAFFPRVQVRPGRDGLRLTFTVQSYTERRRPPSPERFFAYADRNRDGYVTMSETSQGQLRQAFQYLSRVADRDGDGRLSLDEVKTAPPPPVNTGRGAMEHEMPDMADPSQPGTTMQPQLFTTGDSLPIGSSDLERRLGLAAFMTSPDNVWFARSIVNRYWNEMLGEGFYVPVDDLGPDREPALPEVVDVLTEGFVQSGYDLRWLLATIANTEAYRREVSSEHADLPLAGTAGLIPSRKRGDQIYDSVISALGVDEQGPSRRARSGSERQFVSELFGPDPSVAPNDTPGTIPQALFLMNADPVEQMLDADSRTRLAQIVHSSRDDVDVVDRLFEAILGRIPTSDERGLMVRHVRSSQSRNEGFEDVAWSLLNSAEFLARQ